MRKIFVVVILSVLMQLTSCTTKEIIIPNAEFDFELAIKSHLITGFPTYEVIQFNNHSTEGDSYLWGFGNGASSTEKEPNYSYEISGDYKITLTVTSSSGEKSITSKDIRIEDRILENIEIKYLNWDCLGDFSDWPAEKKADVYIEILRDNAVYYTSPILKGISASDTPSVISIPEEDHVVIVPNDFFFHRVAVRLIAIDNGEKNIIYRTDNASGIGFGAESLWNSFRVSTGFRGTIIYFNSVYK